MEDGEADLDPGCDWDTPPGPRDLGLPDLSGVPVGRPPPGPSWSEFLRGRAENKVSVIISLSTCTNVIKKTEKDSRTKSSVKVQDKFLPMEDILPR